MDDRLLFLQALAKFIDAGHISISLPYPPPLDRSFWEQAGLEIKSGDSDALEEIAACLRKNTSDTSH